MIRRSLVAAVVIIAVAVTTACTDGTEPNGTCHITAGEWTCNTQ